MIFRMAVPKGPPFHVITNADPLLECTFSGWALKTRASTCLYGFENKDSVVQNVVVIVHVAFTQVW